MSEIDYYEALGVSRDAEMPEIKKTYRRLVMKYHPDRNRNDKTVQNKLKEVNRAYEVLSDTKKRQIYDRFGHEGLAAKASQGNNSGFHDAGGFGGFTNGNGAEGFFGDIFGSIFGEERRSAGVNGDTVTTSVQINLYQAAHGHVMDVPVQSICQCENCKGSGARSGSKPQTCPRCGGAGAMRVSQGIFSMQQPCRQCSGSGQIIDDPCSSCRGKGLVRKNRTVKLTIPVGVDDGTQLVMRGQGDSGRQGGQSGDLLFQIEVLEHEFFHRESNHLFCQIPVSMNLLALGGELRVPTLDGEVLVKLPAGMQNGKRLRLAGKGITNVNRKNKGDLFYEVIAETPVRLSSRHKALLKELAQLEEERNFPLRMKWTQTANRVSKKTADSSKNT